MRLSAVSALVGTFQSTIPTHVIHEADLLEFAFCTPRGKSTYLQWKINVRQRGEPVKLIAKNRRSYTQKTLVFSIPNEHNGSEIGNSDASIEDQVILPLEKNHSFQQPNVETLASSSHSEEDLSENIERLGDLGSLLQQLKSVHAQILATGMWNASRLKLCHGNFLHNATNLVHYLALKCLDTGQLKEDLASVGLLNLETINSSVLESLNAGILLLENLKFNPVYTKVNGNAELGTQEKSYQAKKRSFTAHAMRKKASLDRESLLGLLRGDRKTHIMVTIGEEALERETLITDLLKAGISIVRINCAHGDADMWDEIIRRVKKSSQMLEAPCRILMDLAGPKLRTAHLQPGPCVMKISTKKSATGNVISPALVWLSHKGAGAPPPHLSPDAVLFIDDQEFLCNLEVGDALTFYDARGKKRMLKISRACHVLSGTGFIAECSRNSYIMSGTKLHLKRKKSRFPVGQVVDVPARDPFVRLKVGDLLIISRNSLCEQDDLSGYASDTHKIACSSGYLFDSVQPGERIAFDDGKIWGVIQGTSISEIVVLVTHAGPRGTKLRSQKSINIPDSKIQSEGLTLKDLTDLEFVSSHADMVGVSFVQNTRDITLLYQELERRKLDNLGIILKIETKSGFKKLPAILLEAMKYPNPLGVMIARGDLAVECGWERLADTQEEILSICGAAHIPVIWATQVLDSLVKTGVPTRAEITDVACGRRASCIMLNKGSHIVEAVSTLGKILSMNSKDTRAELKPAVFSDYLLGES